MASVVDICNSALNLLGASTISALTEDSKNARLCNQRFEPIRDRMFRSHAWNCLTKRVELAKDSENIVITKTFSKAFGLAGLRVGWAYCPKKIAEKLDILKVPFSVNTAAQMAAISALEDDDHINFSVEHNSKWKKILNDCFAEVGLIVYPSQCNFILVEFLESSKFSAKDAYHLLSSKGIIVREMEEYNLPNCLRITIGKEEANLLLIETVNAFKK